jgi:hypothetical protein
MSARVADVSRVVDGVVGRDKETPKPRVVAAWGT